MPGKVRVLESDDPKNLERQYQNLAETGALIHSVQTHVTYGEDGAFWYVLFVFYSDLVQP